MQPAPGEPFGRYLLEAQVGEGGMGQVFRAFDPTLQRRVAIKILRAPRQAERDGRVDRVLREARAAAALDHPGVVSVFDVGEAQGHPFIVMEYVVGRPLRGLIGAREVPLAERLRWLADIARSLAAAHRAGLVHRDIKPENVMIRGDGAVKLLDFGIARQQGDVGGPGATASGPESSVAGTPAYMAPEQVQRRPVDARADQFGWGVLAYELLTGALPWRGPADGVPVAIAVVTEVPERLDVAALGHVAAVVERALEKSPAARFATMDALVRALVGEPQRWTTQANAAASASLDTTPTGRGESELDEPAPRAPRRRMFAGLALAGVASVATYAAIPADAPPPEAWTASAPAQAAYEAGLRRIRAAALHAGIEQFEVAVDYEPDFAAAQLRLALIGLIDGPYPAPSEPYHAAARLRRRLDVRDQALLAAVAPAFEREVPALDEMIDGLTAVAARWPDDPELQLYVPMALSLRGRDDEAAPLYRALALRDPNNATAWLGLAYIHGADDELPETRDALARCLAAAPDAIDCLWYEIKLDAFTGRCEAMERAAIAWHALKPSDHGAVSARVDALIARGRPVREVEAALAELGPGMRVDLRTVGAALTDVSLQILAGEFLAADRVLAELPDDAGVEGHEWLWIGELRVALHSEIGDLAGAAAIADDLSLRKRGLPGSGYILDEGILADPRPEFAAASLAAGELSRAGYVARRAAWLDDWRTRGGGHHEGELWLRAFARPARTAEDALEALAAAPQGPARRFLPDRLFIVDTARVLLLAGRPADALPLLREATASCLASDEPIRWVQAHVLLGDALAATGDVTGACAAYSAVTTRWGAATPTSRTAIDARAHASTLGCAAAAG